MTSTSPTTSLTSVRILRLRRDASCACGERLDRGERVGYDVARAQVLCLRCTSARTRLAQAISKVVDGAEEPLARPEARVSADQAAAQRELCRREVARWRADQQRLEAAWDSGVVRTAWTGLRSVLGSARRGAGTPQAASVRVA